MLYLSHIVGPLKRWKLNQKKKVNQTQQKLSISFKKRGRMIYTPPMISNIFIFKCLWCAKAISTHICLSVRAYEWVCARVWVVVCVRFHVCMCMNVWALNYRYNKVNINIFLNYFNRPSLNLFSHPSEAFTFLED